MSPFNQRRNKSKRVKKPPQFGFDPSEEIFVGPPGAAVGKDSQSNSSNHEYLLSPQGQFGLEAYKPAPGFVTAKNQVRGKRNMRKSYDTTYQRPRIQN